MKKTEVYLLIRVYTPEYGFVECTSSYGCVLLR